MGAEELRVRPCEDDEDLERYYRADSAAFGEPYRPQVLEAKRAVIDPSRFWIAELAGQVVGAAGSFAFSLTLPGARTAPVAGVCDVGVLPTHRRRGVLRALLAAVHEDAAARDEVAAVLTASEATIYGRFGYGVATQVRFGTIDLSRAAFRSDAPVADGDLEVVERADAAPVLSDIYRRVAERGARSGALSRSEGWWGIVLGQIDLYIGGNPDNRVIVHRGADGEADAYAIYRIEERWGPAGPAGVLHVWEVAGVDLAAELAVWRCLFDHDLVRSALVNLPADHVLPLVLADPRALQGTGERDLLWLRPLDASRLLEARSCAADGEVVLGLLGPEGNRQNLHLSCRDGIPTVTEITEPPELELSVSDLAPVLLGDRRFAELAAAGRVREAAQGAAARADLLFATPARPWCSTRF